MVLGHKLPQKRPTLLCIRRDHDQHTERDRTSPPPKKSKNCILCPLMYSSCFINLHHFIPTFKFKFFHWRIPNFVVICKDFPPHLKCVSALPSESCNLQLPPNSAALSHKPDRCGACIQFTTRWSIIY